MADTLTTILGLILLFIVLPVVVLRLNDRRRAARSARSDRAKDSVRQRQQDEQRVLNPDWAAVERRLRRPPPHDLRALYQNRSLVLRRDLKVGDEVISAFEPLDEEGMVESRRWLGFDAVTFATTGFDDAIYLRPGEDEADRVYLTHHDGGDTEVLAESLAEFLRQVGPEGPPGPLGA